MENLHVIVGLGNPGAKYARTRHNAGFQLVELLARRWRAAWTTEKKFDASLAQAERNGRPVMLSRPQTFMNASGESVAGLVNFYRVPMARLLVVVDDADLPLGEIRLRARGSSGGHHGLESIGQHLGSREFARLRLGIGRTPDGRREITDHVLAPFTAAEADVMQSALEKAARQAECWLDDGIEMAMNRFNGAADGPGEKENTE